MIARYSLPRMTAIWSEENRFRKMLDVELSACEVLAKLGKIPKAALETIKRKARFDVERIKEIEAETNHDVIAFIKNVSEYVGEDAKYIHKGLTSSDVVDTGLSVQMREACDILIEDAEALLAALKAKARKHKKTLMIGRTHSVHAEPMTFGLKLALYYDEMTRNLARLKKARETVSVGKLSGAVGTFANIDPAVEAHVCKSLGLRPANLATQILQRDRHAEFMTAIAITGTSLERFATEFRNLQHTEIGEVQEYFSKTQKGSSAMPHKMNPILCERISGLARLLRGNALAAMEDMVLWHERDISHSSAERIIFPDAFHLAVFMLDDMTDVLKNLVVYPENIRRNLELTQGVCFSQKVLTLLVEKGMARQRAYELVQAQAMRSWLEKRSFRELVLADPAIAGACSRGELEKAFSLPALLAGTRDIYRRFAAKK